MVTDPVTPLYIWYNIESRFEYLQRITVFYIIFKKKKKKLNNGREKRKESNFIATRRTRVPFSAIVICLLSFYAYSIRVKKRRVIIIDQLRFGRMMKA